MLFLLLLTLAADPAEAPPPVDAGTACEDLDDDSREVGEAEAPALEGSPAAGSVPFSADLTDEELERRWLEAPESLGSMSVGYAEAGRLINGVQLPADGQCWQAIAPDYAWGTQEMVDALEAAARDVRNRFPTADPLRVNHLGKKDGGYLRPHQSHQSGRDVDLGFFYRAGVDPGAPSAARERLIEPAQNWALLRSLIVNSDVQLILVDRRVQKVLYDFALAHGEDRAWLDGLFNGPAALFQHAYRHRDHFHVRFFAGRAQELGRRVVPLLARRAEQNLVIHRVQRGDTLGRIAQRYGSGVRLIQQANGLTGTLISVGRTLNVPLRGPCTQCPLPPPVQVPPRRLPPDDRSALGAGPEAAPEPQTN